MKKLLIFLLSIVNIVYLRYWLSCVDLNYVYHFSAYDLQLQVIDAIHTDTSSIFVTRFFHNKISLFVLDVFKRYTHLLDIQLLICLISFAGFFGLLLGFWYYFNSKNKKIYITLSLLIFFLFPLLEVIFNFKIAFLIKILIFWIPLFIISSFGNWSFIRSKNTKIVFFIYLILIVLSILWLINFPQLAYTYCTKP